MSYCVYILYSNSADKYYIGSCEDMETRLEQHNGGRNRSTKYGIPWVVKRVEHYESRAEALQRERYIKKMKSKKFVEQVIVGLR